MMVASAECGYAQVPQPMPQGAGGQPMVMQGTDSYGGVPYEAAGAYGAPYVQDGTMYGGGPGGYGGGPGGYGGGPGYGGPDCDGYGGGPMPGQMDDELWNKVHKPNRWYAAFQYTGLKMDEMYVPALVTTSPAGTGQAAAGVLPDATVLFGDQNVGGDWRHGGEVRVGWWLVDGQFLGVEGHYMALEPEETHFDTTSTFTTGTSGFILARPFIDATTGLESSRVLAFDNFNNGGGIVDLDGSISVDTKSDIQSAGVLLRHVLWADFERNLRVDLLGGYRFFKLDESIQIHDQQFTPPSGFVGAVLDERTDLFSTENQFHGGEIGFDAQWYEDNFTFQLIGKTALGNMHELTSISGRRDVTSGGATATTPGGFLAQGTNIGEFANDEFAVIPEGSARIQYSIFENVRVFAGYRVLYLSKVQRPGDSIDRVVNTTQFNGGTLVGDARPAAQQNSTHALLQGIDAGVEFEW
jgi:hypothetical protein